MKLDRATNKYVKREASFADGWRFIPRLKAMFILKRARFLRKISSAEGAANA